MLRLLKTMTAAAALVAATASASANGVMNCTIERNDTNATAMYTFIPAGKDVLAEYAFTLNSNMLIHSPERRPLWSVRVLEYGAVVVSYRPDPRYFLAMDMSPRPITTATLFRNDVDLGSGECRYEPDRQPTRGYRRPGE
jgi:hypothetical protein